MNWNAIFGIACIVAFFVPVGVILAHRFYTHRSLAALFLYFLLMGSFNLVSRGFIPASLEFIVYFNLVCNYLDAPLMLTTLLFFCPSKPRQKPVRILIALVVVYEVVVSFFEGFQDAALVYILGPGISVVLCYAIYLFVNQVKFSILHRKNQGRVFMLAAICFLYSCYGLIYYFYYVQHTQFKNDVLTVYYISSSVASVVMAMGIHLMRKRLKELQQLRITRRELALFFGN